MERILLTKREKEVMRLLQSGGCPSTYPQHVFASCIDTLERKGLAKGAWASGHELVDARLTSYGRTYITLNPSLRNPVDWKWLITTAIAVMGVMAAVAAIFISCSLTN